MQLLFGRPLGPVSLIRQHLDNPHPGILLFEFKEQVRHHGIEAQGSAHAKVGNATLDERDESMPDPNQYLRLLSGRDNPVPREAASFVCVLSHLPTHAFYFIVLYHFFKYKKSCDVKLQNLQNYIDEFILFDIMKIV